MQTNEARFRELWSDYLEGDLGDAGLAELHRMLDDDGRLLELAADTFQIHRLLGVLAARRMADADPFVQDTLRRLPDSSGEFPDRVMARLRSSPSPERRTAPLRLLLYGGWGAAAALTAMWLLRSIGGIAPAPREDAVSFSSLAQASFFGELTPEIASSPEPNRDYSLVSGSVELSFPNGATAIVEAPAVFRVVSDDHLALDIGRCSVHAPDGAEGFRVDTPNSQVVDRGTRFVVNVSESSETEVHVVEGAADIHPEGKSGTLRLIDGDARKIAHGNAIPVPFSPAAYRASLPDRVVSYEAAPGPDGMARTLESVTVQRGGQERRYPADSLIPITLTSFYAGDEPHPIGHLVGEAALPERRASLLEDFNLNTGIINPGGTHEPIAGAFDPERTLGFSVVFREPVKNGPGPDVVLFEIQNGVKIPQGDSFRVSPLEWADGLRSHTVSSYDLMLTSPNALPVSGRFLFQTPRPIDSLAVLESAETARSVSKLRFHAIAVGIDLSDLGYGDGESVSGLFFQDAADDGDQVDPMVIVGLPSD
ncbi:MAG TPA: FecR family protein [Bacteroidia bacterium]|nr:FecR family protein [Bacteroidia bacterium]